MTVAATLGACKIHTVRNLDILYSFSMRFMGVIF